MPTYRVGIVGCGARSTAHAAGWVANESATIAAVADPIQERRDDLGDKHGVSPEHRYPDFSDMLADAELDFISLSTKPELREPAIIAAVEANIRGILCEKPMALSLGEAHRIHSVCAENGIPLVINHQKRHLTEWQRLAAMCANGELGAIERIEASSFGNLASQGTHVLDMVLQFGGDVQPLWAIGQSVGWRDYAGAHAGPRFTLGQYRFPNDITAYVQMGDEAPQLLGREDSWMRLQLRVWGTEGRGQVDLPNGTRVWRKGETEPTSWPESWTDPENLAGAQAGLSQSVIQAAEDPSYDPPAGGIRPLYSFEMIEALCASTLAREVVSWPLPAWDHSPMQSLKPGGVHV
ncbi:MAG: Gfo/Idh/MocA family oxidoreductase [Chloroflexi bacterium]|nr:Gfo/Idh/MocA family oxidoreductase [Chloroflexota bacterium]